VTDIPHTTREDRRTEGDGIVYRQAIGDTAAEFTLYKPDDAGFAVITAELDHPAGTATVHIELSADLLRHLADDGIDLADELERPART
jgi:hypothetical protein